jgi:hypothetical protein
MHGQSILPLGTILFDLPPIDFEGKRQERSRTGIGQFLARMRFKFAKALVDGIAMDK